MALLSACLCLRLYPASRTSGRETDEAARFPWKQALITCFVAGLVLAYRKTDALMNPQLWAEDGSVFFIQNDLLGLKALWTPHAGYLHVLPRLISSG
jgi:hypothetical protein